MWCCHCRRNCWLQETAIVVSGLRLQWSSICQLQQLSSVCVTALEVFACFLLLELLLLLFHLGIGQGELAALLPCLTRGLFRQMQQNPDLIPLFDDVEERGHDLGGASDELLLQVVKALETCKLDYPQQIALTQQWPGVGMLRRLARSAGDDRR